MAGVVRGGRMAGVAGMSLVAFMMGVVHGVPPSRFGAGLPSIHKG
jgi:hypothetical protein